MLQKKTYAIKESLMAFSGGRAGATSLHSAECADGHGGTLMLLCADSISVYIYLTIGKHFKALLYVNSMLIVC